MKNIIFDFDGVIIDSMHIRTFGFQEIFKEFNKSDVEKIVNYHKENGGISRFAKIKYFFNTILNKFISEDEILKYADKYSIIMKDNLTSPDIIINETVKFIKNNYQKYNMHIASGSEQNELQFLNKTLELDKYFLTIYGSPTPKINLVKNILKENNYNENETILIGDSINDYDASHINNITFLGYNNVNLKKVSHYYINNFKDFQKEYKELKC